MCGRYSLAVPGDLVAEHFRLESAPELAPRFNIAPSQEAPIVTGSGDSRRCRRASWGLVPRWSEAPGSGPRPINARSESVAGKASFRDSYERRRCLVPADGFYEWRRSGRHRQPFYFQLAGGGLMAFAGLWDRWSRGGENLVSFTVLTISANELVRKVHDRMPVILEPQQYASWLAGDGAPPLELAPLAADRMTHWPVSTFVNSPANDAPRCIHPVDDRQPEQLSWLTD